MQYKIVHPNYKRKISFSGTEIIDLLKAWFGISIAFALVLKTRQGFGMSFLIAAIAVGSGFLLHELAHKFVAQRYGCFAEFKSFDKMLILALILAYFFHFVFVAPGAVMIYGVVHKRQSGRISVAGPIMNLFLGAVFFGLSLLTSRTLSTISSYGAYINILLGLFNMLPIPGFDGTKVLMWNRKVYALVAGISLLMMIGATMLIQV